MTRLARARAFAEAVGKTCVVVERDIAGFVTSRLLIAFVNEAMALVEGGVATPADIDTACRLGFGHVMGPLATVDLTGLDVILHAARAIYAETGDEKFAPPAAARADGRGGHAGPQDRARFLRLRSPASVGLSARCGSPVTSVTSRLGLDGVSAG